MIRAIHHRTVPIRSQIRNAVIDFSQMTASAVAIVTDVERGGEPVVGFGFSSNGRYSQEGILRERIVPRLLAARDDLANEAGDNLDPHRAWDVMMRNEKPGGHGERSVAVGVVDMALWDAVAKIEGLPLHELLARRYGTGESRPSVEVYAAGGYYHPGKDDWELQRELESYLSRGYTQVKMKVGGAPLAEDLRRIEAALEVVEKGSCLAVDANARFGLEESIRFGKAVEGYGLKWYEEPCDPLDFETLRATREACSTPLATGENLFSRIDSLNLLRYGGLDRERDTLRMDPVLSYGLVEYLRILESLEESGWSARRCMPHGGHQFALHIAAGLGLGGNEAYPDVFFPFSGFADNTPIEDGRVVLDSAPGIGFENKASVMEVFAPLAEGKA